MKLNLNANERIEIASKGLSIYQRRILPGLRPEDNGKYIAIDIDSEEFEIDSDDYTAVQRLRSRITPTEIWLARAGHPTTCRLGHLS